MTSRISALGVESLVLSPDRPTPITIPESGGLLLTPSVFDADWSTEITVRTRWLTDVTYSPTGGPPEKWALVSRPTRTVTARVSGMSREETAAMLASAVGHTNQRGPVPIYPDAVLIRSVDGNTVEADFRYRRFFVGGRVALIPPKGDASPEAVGFAFLDSVAAGSATLRNPTRPPTTSDLIVPCIDSETLEEAPGESAADGLWAAEVSWVEVEGPSALPSLWPPCTYNDSSYMEALCQVVDGRPVFPFEPNWGEAVGASVLRAHETDDAGRASSKTPSELYRHRVSFSVMGYDRQRAWSILRFFDAVQGRAKSFYLIHPTRPWSATTPPVAAGLLSQVKIKRSGDPYSISYYRRVAVIRADGEVAVRKITSVVDSGSFYTLLLDSPLPDTNFVDVQPVFLGAFESDEIEEVWATSEVATSIQVSFLEDVDGGAVSPTNPTSLTYLEQIPPFFGYEGLNLLLAAGQACFDSSGKPSLPYPADSQVARWEDISRGLSRNFRQPPAVKALYPSSPLPSVITFSRSFDNNKRPAISGNTDYSLSFQADPATPLHQRHLWSSSGEWTICICISASTLVQAAADRGLVMLSDAAGVVFGMLHHAAGGANPSWGGVLVRPASSPSGPPLYSPFTFDYRTIASAVYFTARMDATSLRVWINGRQALSASMSVPGGVFMPSILTSSRWFTSLGSDTAILSSTLNSYGSKPCANLVVSYAQAMSISDLDSLHREIADLFLTTHTPVVLY